MSSTCSLAKGIVTCQYRDRGFGEDYVYPEASFAIASSPPLSGVGLTLAPWPTAVTSDTLTAASVHRRQGALQRRVHLGR